MNDWSELVTAVEQLSEYYQHEDRGYEDYETLDPSIASPIIKYVPRLLAQYQDLLVMMNQTIDAIAEFKRLGEGGQLLVADSQEVRQFGA